MKKTVIVALAALLLVAAMVVAQTPPKLPKTYQVTGPVVALTDEIITVEKGTEKWEIERTKDTKTTGELKVGAKVTVMYRMTAASIEVKAAEAKKTPKK